MDIIFFSSTYNSMNYMYITDYIINIQSAGGNLTYGNS